MLVAKNPRFQLLSFTYVANRILDFEFWSHWVVQVKSVVASGVILD
ncbi:hypothetical protein [Calothrix sp. NIES-2100]